jgi:GT2 family glycosyltransferase
MKNNKKYGFVILHYLAIEETLACVDSIKQHCGSSSFYIVIVDNNSSNKTGEVLAEHFKNDSSVAVLLNDKNDGYARGNNIGIDFINEKFNSDFVIVLNNDIELVQNNFCELISKEYNESHFAVLGPKISLPYGRVDSYPFEPMKRKELYGQIISNLIKISLINTGVYMKYLEAKRKRTKAVDVVAEPKKTRREDIVLHGSCLVFSKLFFEKYDGFDPRTFMYKEEQLLFWMLKKANLVSVYNPEINVLHKAEASTKKATGSKEVSKLKFLYKNQLFSSLILIKEINKTK